MSKNTVVLNTERLILRRLSPDDAAFILELLNEPSFLLNIGDKGVRNERDAVNYLQDGPMASYERFGFGLYAVVLQDSGEPIGICGLLKRDSLPDADIGFAFLPKFWSKGYAVESAAAVLRYAANTLKLKRVLAITVENNHPSIKVLETIGLRYEGLTKTDEGAPELKLFAIDL